MTLDSAGRTDRNFGRYQLVLEMARGGMATIYLARLRGPQQFEKLLVVKRIHEHQAQDDKFIQMFLDEARIAARIEHPNVATVFDLGQNAGAYFLAMEYVHGHNIAEIVKTAYRRPGVLHWSHAVRMVADAAAGLHGAHEAKGSNGRELGIVHRDVSPQNILVSYDGHVKVVDFGIAFAAERLTHTASGTVKGKAAYMSPEQVCMEPLDRRSDIFSLGIVLFEAICQRRLFKEAMEAATILRVRDAVVPPPRSVNPEIPASLERVMLKALAKRPEDRFQTAAELEAALDQVLHGTRHPVSHRQLSSLMDTLFYDVRKMRDRQVCDALEQFDETGPMRAMGMGMGDSASSGAVGMPDSTVLQRPAPRVRRRVVIPVAGALILAGVLLVAFSSALGLRCNDNAATRGAGTSAEGDAQRGGEPEGVGRADDSPRAREEPDGALAARPDATARPRARVAAMGDTLAHPRNVTLELSIRPKRAQSVVRFRGRLFWGSEFQMQVPRSAQSEIVEVRAPGYRTVRREVRLSTDVRQTIRLRATRRHVGRGPSRKLVRPRPAVRSRQAVPPGRARPRNAADLTKDLPED